MNLLKKLDIFLLEKFPLLWHTKLLYTCFFSLIISALFYLWGYIFTDEFHISRFSESSYFERSNALLCFLILNAIFIIIWALAFFRKSAVKNLYPLQRFYFSRLLCSFLFIFWSLTWSFTTFNWGVNAKIRKLAPLSELKEHIQTINFADAFLFDNDFSYGTYNRIYHPNVVEISFDYNDSIWNNMPTALYMDSIKSKPGNNKLQSKYTNNTSPVFETIYNPSFHPENNDTVDHNLVQFLVTKTVLIHSHCSGSDENNYLVAVKKLNQLCPNALHDLRNFSKREISPTYFEYPKYATIFQSYAEGRNFHLNVYYDDYIQDSKNSVEANESFTSFLATSKKEDIVQLLKKYEQLLVRHKIGHSINVHEIVDYVWKRQRNMNFKTIVGESSNDKRQAELDLSRFGNLESYEIYRSGTEEYEQPLYFVETQQLQDLYSNSMEAHNPAINWIPFIVSIYFALGFAFLFFLFAIGNPINLIIAASIGGVFVILNILFFLVFLESPRYINMDYDPTFRIFAQLLVFSGILYSLLYIFYSKKNISKRLLLITFNLCFVISLFVPLFIYGFLESILSENYMDSCFQKHTRHSVFYYWGQDPMVIWLSVFGAILIFTYLIKPVLAKPE